MEDLHKATGDVLLPVRAVGIPNIWHNPDLDSVSTLRNTLLRNFWLKGIHSVFSVVNGVLFTEPPYNFSVGQAGLVSVSPFILCIIGEAISGPLNDWICLKLAHRNHGVYEPEFRLVLMVVVVILGTTGFYGFGATVHYQTHWTGPVLTFGFANMCLAFGSTCVFGYVLVRLLLDSHFASALTVRLGLLP